MVAAVTLLLVWLYSAKPTQLPVVAVVAVAVGLRATAQLATLVVRCTSTALQLLVPTAALGLAQLQPTPQLVQAATVRLAAHLATVGVVAVAVGRKTPLQVPLVLVGKAARVVRLAVVVVVVAVLAAHQAVRAMVVLAHGVRSLSLSTTRSDMERILVLVDTDTDIVINVIVATDDYQPPAGVRAIEAPGAKIGWLWAGGEQVPPEEALE